jgi:nucleotide-binding universal stress UspA family protein
VSSPILVGYDPKSADTAPVDFAVAAARFTGAPLVVAAVFPGGSVLERLSGGEHGHEGPDQDDDALDELRSRIKVAGVQASFEIVRHTTPARGLSHVIEQAQPGLLVLGSTHRGGVGRVLPGSTAERIVHGAPCAVVVVPHGHEIHQDGISTVGAAFAPTPEGREALRAAALLAHAAQARLRAIMVLDPKRAEEESPGLMADQHRDHDPAEDVAARHSIDAERTLRDAIAELASRVETEPDILFQDPADGVVAASRTLDLLVMGSRAYGPLRAVMLGGVSRQVTAKASCPVLVLPRGAEGQLDALLSEAEARVVG